MTTILAITSYLKGEEFLREAKRQGAHVILVTKEKLADAAWPRDHIDQIFLMPDLEKLPDVLYGVSYLMRQNKIDRIVPLDEYECRDGRYPAVSICVWAGKASRRLKSSAIS